MASHAQIRGDSGCGLRVQWNVAQLVTLAVHLQVFNAAAPPRVGHAQRTQFGLINKSVPKEQLREAVIELACKLLEKNPVVLRYAKTGFKRCRELTWEQGEDYLYAKVDQSNHRDPEQGRKGSLMQFLDDKTIKPGLQTYQRP